MEEQQQQHMPPFLAQVGTVTAELLLGELSRRGSMNPQEVFNFLCSNEVLLPMIQVMGANMAVKAAMTLFADRFTIDPIQGAMTLRSMFDRFRQGG